MTDELQGRIDTIKSQMRSIEASMQSLHKPIEDLAGPFLGDWYEKYARETVVREPHISLTVERMKELREEVRSLQSQSATFAAARLNRDSLWAPEDGAGHPRGFQDQLIGVLRKPMALLGPILKRYGYSFPDGRRESYHSGMLPDDFPQYPHAVDPSPEIVAIAKEFQELRKAWKKLQIDLSNAEFEKGKNDAAAMWDKS